LKKFVPIFSIVVGIYWIVMGFNYEFWVRKGPGGGFIPVLAGIMAVGLGILVYISSNKDKTPIKFSFKALLPVAGIVLLILVSYVTGLVIAIALYVFLWLKFMEKYKTSKSIIIGFCTATVIYGVFVAWLKVPLPTGLFELL